MKWVTNSKICRIATHSHIMIWHDILNDLTTKKRTFCVHVCKLRQKEEKGFVGSFDLDSFHLISFGDRSVALSQMQCTLWAHWDDDPSNASLFMIMSILLLCFCYVPFILIPPMNGMGLIWIRNQKHSSLTTNFNQLWEIFTEMQCNGLLEQ